jgi:hypothetical protein
MIHALIAAALALQAAPAPQAPAPAPSASPALSQENRALLRCAAAFALTATAQANGDAAAQQWPVLATRGREFFVRAMAQLMDATGLDRAGISQLASKEAQALTAAGDVDKVMPSCLIMLESAGL